MEDWIITVLSPVLQSEQSWWRQWDSNSNCNRNLNITMCQSANSRFVSWPRGHWALCAQMFYLKLRMQMDSTQTVHQGFVVSWHWSKVANMHTCAWSWVCLHVWLCLHVCVRVRCQGWGVGSGEIVVWRTWECEDVIPRVTIIYGECLDLKIYYSKMHCHESLSILLVWNTISYCHCHYQSLKSYFLNVFAKYDQKYSEFCYQVSSKGQINLKKNLFLAPSDFWLIQVTAFKPFRTLRQPGQCNQIHSQNRTSRNSSESGKKHGVRVAKGKECKLKGTDSSVSPTVRTYSVYSVHTFWP